MQADNGGDRLVLDQDNSNKSTQGGLVWGLFARL